MSFLSRLFNPPRPLSALWGWITSNARQPHYYLDYKVPDTVDGRFDMVALMTSLVMLEMERRDLVAQTAILTERVVEDMDGSLREIGIGDMVIGKHMGKVMGAMGGRLAAYRAALAEGAPANQLAEALGRNVFRGEPPVEGLEAFAADVRKMHQRVRNASDAQLLAGEI